MQSNLTGQSEEGEGSSIAQGKCIKMGGVLKDSRSSLCLRLTKRFAEAHCSALIEKEYAREEDRGREWVRLLLPAATPCKGESGKLGGRGLGEIIEKGWHTLKSMPGMMLMHTTMIIQTVLFSFFQSNCSPVCCSEKRLYWKPTNQDFQNLR